MAHDHRGCALDGAPADVAFHPKLCPEPHHAGTLGIERPRRKGASAPLGHAIRVDEPCQPHHQRTRDAARLAQRLIDLELADCACGRRAELAVDAAGPVAELLSEVCTVWITSRASGLWPFEPMGFAPEPPPSTIRLNSSWLGRPVITMPWSYSNPMIAARVISPTTPSAPPVS